jgi:uncharacterized protein (DUF1499 family)
LTLQFDANSITSCNEIWVSLSALKETFPPKAANHSITARRLQSCWCSPVSIHQSSQSLDFIEKLAPMLPHNPQQYPMETLHSINPLFLPTIDIQVRHFFTVQVKVLPTESNLST